MITQFASLYDLMEAFPDEQSCIDHFTAIRWANGEFCPYCGHDKLYHFADKRTHKCAQCRQRFSIKVKTIFEDTKVPLRKWFMAIWLITSHKKGIASTQIAKDIKVTQKTGWFMLHRLRHAARTRSFNGPPRPLKGVVEIDETFVGGREKNKHADKRNHIGGSHAKTIVFGMLERGGELRAMIVDNLKANTVHPIINANVKPGTAVMTDEGMAYRGMDYTYQHESVSHAQGEYARGNVYTNSIQGAWSLLKRQIYGIHHWVSVQHLARYVSEVVWRYNGRDIADGFRMNEFLSRVDGRLTYNALIGKA
jgi:transposase-like protein